MSQDVLTDALAYYPFKKLPAAPRARENSRVGKNANEREILRGIVRCAGRFYAT